MATGKETWDAIKDRDIDVFAMQSKVHKFCSFVDIDETKCYVSYKAGAVLPALETVLGDKFTVSLVEKYLLIEPVSPTLLALKGK